MSNKPKGPTIKQIGNRLILDRFEEAIIKIQEYESTGDPSLGSEIQVRRDLRINIMRKMNQAHS